MTNGANFPDIVHWTVGGVGSWTGPMMCQYAIARALPRAQFPDDTFVTEFTAFEIVFAHFARQVVVLVVLNGHRLGWSDKGGGGGIGQ